jgi:Kip1 ubiquitination-promoting complex protein 1
MNYCRTLTNIFGISFESNEKMDVMRCLDEVNKFLDEKLENFKEPEDNNENHLINPSKVVVWDTESTDNLSNLVKLSKDRLSLISQSAFSTLKANCCVFLGKFMYEIQVREFIDL